MKVIIIIISTLVFAYSQCDDLLESQCNNDDNCVWIENIETANCYNLSWNEEECISNGCNYSCTSYYGCWCSGEYEINNSDCQELSFIPGDINGDGSLNISDIVLIVDLILNSEYNEYSDINQDSALNLLDIVELIYKIVNGDN